MKYEFKNGKVLTRCIKYCISYHCNLRCSNCVHLSPFSRKHFPSVESFTADVNQLSKGLHSPVIELLGGEPLLNPQINSYIKEAKESKIADMVRVTTNGLLLHRMNDEFWKNIDEVSVSIYPYMYPNETFLQIFKRHAEESNTQLDLSPISCFRTTVVTKPHPSDWITKMIFKTCKDPHALHHHMIHEGMLYKCAIPAFLPDYLSRMGQNDYMPLADAFDIHNSSDVYQDVKAYLTSRAALDACRYCLGHAGKCQDHSQIKAEYLADPGLQNISRSTHLDTRRFIADSLFYFGRRTLEKLTGKNLW